MNYTNPFKSLNKTSAEIAGGKGASLGEMLNAGIPVPDGFVVLSTTFDAFIKQADLVQEIEAVLDTVDHKIISSVESASEKIQELIKHATMPQEIADEILSEFKSLDTEFVAVRSSATAEDGADHAWAGQLESYLNTTQDTLLEKVQHCWASLFTPRAIFYRFEKGLHTTHISVAVVVQKMVNSEKSGIAFSVHPVTEDRNQLIIEAGLGLGEAIVSGSVTPDSYVVEKEPRNIVDINVNHQNRALYRQHGGGNEWKDLNDTGKEQVLDQEEILKLSEIILTIENHYGFPCDIEWAFESGKFYIVQSRPITTLSAEKQNGDKIDFEKAYTRDTTLIIQQAWNECVTSPFYANNPNPHLPPVIHYMNDGVIEIWENEKATQWILDSVQELIKTDEQRLVSLIDQYEKDLVEIKGYWEKGPITDPEEFAHYVDRVYEVMKGFDCMYFPSLDERTPANIRERTLKLRDTDTYFDSNDRLMRASLIAMYPHLKGYEQCILKNEVKNPPSIELLKARKQSFVVIGEQYAEQTTLREYLSKHPEYHFHIEIPPADSSTLIGQVGNKGYAKGKVRIMKRKEQISEAQDGDIIVSTMTTPDFVPAMQKAAAIITDEGGITCHAAIVARELNKPCVIGTKFATELLKDGDEVEVDADNGVVKMLNTSKLLAQEFIDSMHGGNSIPSLNGYSLFVFASGYNTEKYYGRVYKKELEYSFLNVRYGSKTQAFLPEDVWKGYASEVFAEFLKDNNYINKVKENFYKNFPAIDHLYSTYTYDYISHQSEGNLLKFIQEDFDLFWKTNAWSHFSIYFDLDLCFHVLKEIYPEITKTDLESIWHNATDMVAESFDKAQKRDILSYLVEYGNSDQLTEHCQYFLTSYKNVQPLEKVAEELEKTYGEFIKDPTKARSELNRMNDELNKKTSEFENWKSTLPTTLQKVSEFCQLVMQVRDQRKNHFSKGLTIAWRAAELLFEKAGVDKKLIENILPLDELIKGSDHIANIKDELEKRENGYVVYVPYHGSKKISYDHLEENQNLINDYFNSHHDKEATEIKGQVGNKGKVKGVVRIIRSQDQFDLFKDGEILVTGMTRPEYVPLMRIAKAIITDEGGITCHAAIVSRELNKPCVIGTKFATQIFKDGDEVEVDADSGIVKIIK
jgi:phosphoenolpyruvate synthase/pyruvate phosphate dikinase